MGRRNQGIAVAVMNLPRLGLAAPAAHAQRANFHPSYTPHYGCFGYCPGPLTPRPEYWGCFGYCNGPLHPRPEPHWGCFGYCPEPLNPYPTWVVYPQPGFSG